MASLSDVAKAAGVSLTTASLVLNRPKQPNRVSSSCAQRVRDVAETLGYIPNYHARSMKLGRAETIAVVMDVGASNGTSTVSELADGYFNQLFGGIELHLRSVGYQMMLVGPNEYAPAPRRGLEGLRQRRFDGMIVLCAASDPGDEAVLSGESDAAIVAIEYTGRTVLPVVEYDQELGVGLAVRHLVGLKHKRLLWVGTTIREGCEEGGAREQLFTKAAREVGISAEFLRFDLRPEPGRTTRVSLLEQARAAMARRLAEQPRRAYTAVVANNDPVALGVIGALVEAGVRVPRDVSVVGFDDVEAAFCIPGLTTVNHRLAEMGRRAAELVMEMVTDGAARERLRGRREVMRPELIMRESTAVAVAGGR